VTAGRVIHADDTPVPVMAPGAGRTEPMPAFFLSERIRARLS
jgi:hypothetical protein